MASEEFEAINYRAEVSENDTQAYIDRNALLREVELLRVEIVNLTQEIIEMKKDKP